MALSQSTPSSVSTLAFLVLLGGGVAVGFSPTFARLSDLAPLASGFYRLAFAVPAIWLAVQASGGELGIFAFLAASLFAAYLLLVANVRRQCSTGTIMFYTTLISALAMLPFAFALSPTILSGSLDGCLILLALAVISHAGGQGLMTFALAHLPTSFSSMMGLMQTAVAAILAWILLSEPLTLMMLARGAAILAGIWSCRKATAG
jgi:drug/metabolite transporter (DMT)-like permease